MAEPQTKILVIGIDAANPALVRRWAGEGALPNIRSLLARGIVGRTSGIEGFFVGATWPSFYTGRTPARHGFHYLTQLRPGTYESYRPAAEGIVACEPFWTRLSRAGRRVAIFDVPLSALDRSINGIQAVEWGAHDSVYRFQAWPPRVEETIRSRFGAYPLEHSCNRIERSAAGYRSFVDALVRGARRKAELTGHFLRSGGWDLFVQVFTEAHCAGHQCWHLHDPNHPAHDPALLNAIGDPLRAVYVAIDAAIGELLEAAGDAPVVLFVPHGMSHWYGADFLLDEILFRLGAMKPALDGDAGSGPLALATTGARWAWRRLPGPIRRAFEPLRRRFRPRTGVRGGLPELTFDPRSSRCFSVSNGMAVSGIRLNLAGREPAGILAPAAAEEFCKNLADDLSIIVDERDQRPLVRRVLRTAEIYAGERLGSLPDLLVEWNDAVPTGNTAVGKGAGATVRANAPKIGVVEGTNHYGRTGQHRPEGWFIASGPAGRPEALQREFSILDFAPTFGKLLGVDLPDCDGRAVDELMRICGAP